MFVPGDTVIQRYQHGAQPKLVLATTTDPKIVIAHGRQGDKERFHRVFVDAYDLVSADEASRERAADLVLSEAYELTTSSAHW